MSYRGSWKIDDYLTFCCNTHDPDTGVATDAASVPTYRVYEDETATPILTGSMALLDAANTAGFYSERIQLTAANGFEKGKCYTIYITATVDSDAGTTHHFFQIEAEVDANAIADGAIANATFAADVGSTAYATNIIALAVRKVLDEINLDHLLAVVTAAADMTAEVIDNSILSRILGNGDTSTFAPSTDGLHAAGVDLDTILADTNELQTDDTPAAIAALPTAAENADAVWNEASTGHVDAGKAGQQLWTDLDAVLADTNELQTDDTPAAIAALNDPTAAAVADAVWDEALSAHDTEDSVGNVLNDLTEESDGTYRFTEAALAESPTSAGAGAITFTYTLLSSVDSAPIASATVWVTTDQAGSNVVASGTTNTSGEVVFYLDAGTYYVWREKSGFNFTNPDTETVA